ncbi:YhgE/Pip domain-containing protein [Bacillus sp. FJAT-49732]|uniref:YhgE/Pip domain-containing protein n=1 Tax=Lederbergia citrisecunda TaxID=2833583 RepID=A0A942YMT7_9BACI|nr:YhgE/Pip domain-containing protein [Lederbergia citrisecunda]MBS4201844.1 YhgE/Pip domain-containing protein [Lederbergia citrisecunda]
MNNIIKIYTNDLKNIVTNWAAAILIGGLIVLPSLYAWLNIAAMWDPYSETGNLPVAIVNEDAGAKIRDQEINVGKELVNTLNTNKNMDWHFTNRERAMDEVNYGNYFAVIIIPKDFSGKLASVISVKPEKAQMEYYVNEKINSVSPKITQKGASLIVEQVSSKFISTVNGVIFDLFNEIGIELARDLPDIERFEHYIFILEENLPEINRVLNESLADATSAQNILNKAEGKIPEVRRLTNNGLDTINKTTDFITAAEDRLNAIAPKIKEDVERVQKISDDINRFLNNAQNVNIDLSKGDEIQKNLQTHFDNALQTIDVIESSLLQLKKINSEQQNNAGAEQLDQAIAKTGELKSMLQTAQSDVAGINQLLSQKRQEFKDTLATIKNKASTASAKLDTFIQEYNNTIEPTILNEVAKAKKTLLNAKTLLTEAQSTLPEVERILSSTQGNLKEGKKALDYAHGQFPYVNAKVKELTDKIRKLKNKADINEIIHLLRHDPNAERNFFEEPVKLNEHKLFPIENYGTGMTPFYTVLSIWVGALLLISLLAIDVHHDSYTGKQIYFGRFLTFLTIGFLQTLIVTLGDLLILKVSVSAPVWFVIFGLFICLIFMLIVYSLVSVFGNVGKAMAIIMLVLQIAGSGGTYPVVLLPKFFRMISPFLPFTYAVDLMREAVGGIVWQRVLHDLLFLSIFGIIALLFGTFLKEPLNNKTKALLKKSKESGLFH